MNSYRNPNNAMSFLPEDTITPAIQNMGQTLGAINQQKIGQQEGLQKQFQSLLDVSYENMLANHQNEVMQDWDKFKSKAINVFKSAAEAGKPINQNEYANVIKEHNNVIRKAEYARQLKQDYYKTMAEAGKLDAANKLDPESKQLLDDWKNKGGSLYDLPVPSSLIRTQYSPMEIGTIEKGMYNSGTLLKETYKNLGGGRTEPIKYYDPENVAKVAIDRVKTDPDFAKAVQKNYGSLQNYIKEKQDIYDKEYKSLKLPPAGAQAPIVNRATRMPLPDGREQISFAEETPKEILLNGKTVKASSAGAIYDPKTGKYTTYLRIPKKIVDEYGDEKTIEEQVQTEDYAVYQKFAEEIKGRVTEPKPIKGGAMADKRVDLLNTIIKKKK